MFGPDRSKKRRSHCALRRATSQLSLQAAWISPNVRASRFSVLRMVVDSSPTAHLDEHREKWSFQACFILLPTSSLDQSKRARVMFSFPSVGRWSHLRLARGARRRGCGRYLAMARRTVRRSVRTKSWTEPSLRSQAAAGPCGFTTRRSSGCTSSRFSFREHKD